MKLKLPISIFTIILIFIQCRLDIYAKKPDECMNCHLLVGDKLQKPADDFVKDIHYLRGITCAACHGGDATTDDMEAAMDKKKGYIGIPLKKTRYEVCIACHTDEKTMRNYGYKGPVNQYEHLQNSIHFKQSYNNQGPIADCITCHGAHGITSVKNPSSKVHPSKIVALCAGCHSDAAFMKNYNPGLPVDQAAKYRTSIHGAQNLKGDTRAAQCASCHGNHDIRRVKDPRSSVYITNIAATCSHCHSDAVLMAPYKIPTDQYDKYKRSVHGVALLEKGDVGAPSCNGCHGNHGAVPPGVESISKVCGTCHALNMELFEKSPHKSSFEREKLPECESCHSNHEIIHATDELLGVGKNATCITCHKEGDKGYLVGKTMREMIDSLKNNEKTAVSLLAEANKLGMDVSDEEYELKNLRQILIKARTSVHTFNLEEYEKEIEPGFQLAKETVQNGQTAVDNYYFRRKGLLVSTIIVSLLVVLLYIKLRRIEKTQKESGKL